MEIKCTIFLKYHTQPTNPMVLINYRGECIDLTALASITPHKQMPWGLILGLIAIELLKQADSQSTSGTQWVKLTRYLCELQLYTKVGVAACCWVNTGVQLLKICDIGLKHAKQRYMKGEMAYD